MWLKINALWLKMHVFNMVFAMVAIWLPFGCQVKIYTPFPDIFPFPFLPPHPYLIQYLSFNPYSYMYILSINPVFLLFYIKQ